MSSLLLHDAPWPILRTFRRAVAPALLFLIFNTAAAFAAPLLEFPVPRGSGPHDVAPAPDGAVWYTAQGSGELGRLDPKTGKTSRIPLGEGSRPHGVIVGPDGAPWITDGGLNAIVRVDPATREVRRFPLPKERGDANLNTATFDPQGRLWFTGQSGIYGRLDPKTGKVELFDAPKGPGAYGIATAPDGSVYFVSLAGSYLARIDPKSGAATVIAPPTPDQGARRVWADSRGRLWISEWNAGQVGMYDPAKKSWKEWRAPGARPKIYAVFVDDKDKVWLTDFGANALLRFDPEKEAFETFPLPSPGAGVRQILGRAGEVWGAESGADKLVVIRTEEKAAREKRLPFAAIIGTNRVGKERRATPGEIFGFVFCLIAPGTNIPGIEMKMTLPPEVELLDGDPSFKGDLDAAHPEREACIDVDLKSGAEMELWSQPIQARMQFVYEGIGYTREVQWSAKGLEDTYFIPKKKTEAPDDPRIR